LNGAILLALQLFCIPLQAGDVYSLENALQNNLSQRNLPIGNLLLVLGTNFKGVPYLAGTLDEQDREQLVLQAPGLDCFTFVETSLALTIALKGSGTLEDYRKALQLLRYRGGVIDGYPSRLHYTCDWAFDNSLKLILKDITSEIGGEPYPKQINFMTHHRAAYRQLKSEQNYHAMQQVEALINERTRAFIPKEHLRQLEAKIQNGDVLAITTSIEGLDVVHVGLAIFINERLHLLHASSRNKKVEVTSVPLVEYLANSKSRNGVMVFRPQEHSTPPR